MTAAAASKTLEEQAIDIERARRHAKRFVDAELQPIGPPLVPLSIAQLEARPAPSFLVESLVPAASLFTLIGASGTRKTFLALHVCLCVAGGQSTCLGFSVVGHGPVLYVAAEGGGAFQYRALAACAELGIDPANVP